MDYFEFIETPTFVRQRESLLDDDTFQQLQEYLLKQHVDGDTIKNTGGCKKLRWNRPGTGRRGGVRVIYYAVTRKGKLYLLTVYAKNVKDDMTEAEKSVLKRLTTLLDQTLSIFHDENLRTILWISNCSTPLYKAWKRWWRLKKAKCNPLASTATLCRM
ncbi:type II toxin-antitoxin system RelE/ParE family toxin [Buttiauxella sp. WJP83]|uniref:type II toxin-antitoxin system RelE/ParE family toxin n=1 Tax=Buttiauxella sp. WJP83 TaxID=2986951 RepID=UPI002FD3AACB